MHRLSQQYGLYRMIAYGVIVVVAIIASALPLDVLQPIVKSIAGKHTQITIDVPLEAVAGASVVINLGQLARGKGRKRELERLRNRQRELEARLGMSPKH